ncbi:collagen alpha-1(I) chain-like isoform X2 [Pantherophis guttatus]|uniref:Collagen alpha-1(I) chain-like isoform X2 n=1 Tax=Pantherophis guttatus TaxID=94885 RepID=A0A6P9AVA6_PANGU|nr:collagen alpha-1(I) chain-like isoform X2 [Pantherophis guttatus]
MPRRLERLANVVLRVPPVVLLDLLYRWDVQAFADTGRPLAERLPLLRGGRLWSLCYAGHLLCLMVLVLPLLSLVQLYLQLLALLLLYLSHQVAWDYIDHEVERGFQGAIYEDPVALGHFATALTGGGRRPLRSAAEDPAGGAALRPPPPAGRPAVLPPSPGSAHRQLLRGGPGGLAAPLWGSFLPHGAFPHGCGRLPRDLPGPRGLSSGDPGRVPLEAAGCAAGLLHLLAGPVRPADLHPGLLLLLRPPPLPTGLALRLPQQRGQMLHHPLLAHRTHLRRLLPGPGIAPAGQALFERLRSLPGRQRHPQGRDGRGDAVAAGHPDGPPGPSTPPEDLPAHRHLLHRGHLHSPICDRNSRASRSGAGGIAEQEFLETLPWGDPLPVSLGGPRIHGLQNRPLLPAGFLAGDPHLQLHADFPAGDGDPLRLRPLRGRAPPEDPRGEDGRDPLLRPSRQPGAGVPGGPVRGDLRHLGVHRGRVDVAGGLGHHRPLLLQRLAEGPIRLEELLAPLGGGQEDRLATQGHQQAAGGSQRLVCHLLPGNDRRRDHALRPHFPRRLPSQVVLRAGHLSPLPPGGSSPSYPGSPAK